MVLNSAMSPTTKFLLRVFHFWRSCNDCRYSFLERDQILLTMCCTCLHHLLQYKSGLRNFTGGGMTIFGFIVKVLADVMAESYQGHLSFPLSEVQSLGFLQFQSSIWEETYRSGLFNASLAKIQELHALNEFSFHKLHRCGLQMEGFWVILSNHHQYPPWKIGCCCHSSQNMPSSVLFLHQWNYVHWIDWSYMFTSSNKSS